MSAPAQHVRTEYAPVPGSPPAARRLVRRTLVDWRLEHLTEVASLLVSELATNAVLHARTPFAVQLERFEALLRISVLDCSHSDPARRSPGPGSSTGRGLALVASLAAAWGTHPDVAPWTKAVWCELAISPVRG